MKKKSLLVGKYKDDLRAYADLRNDIIHHRSTMEFVIYQFISRYITIYEAERIFKQGVEHGRRFEVLLITEHGKPHQN